MRHPTSLARTTSVTFRQELQARSAARVAGDQDFAYLREDIAQLKQRLAAKTVSLNEADRRQEKAEAKAREEVRKQERAARKDSQPASYDITLKNANIPGLPAPASTLSSPVAKLPAPVTDEADEPQASNPQSDPILRESERILADYVGMVQRHSSVAVAAH